MNEQQANDLAARIVAQFPHVSTVVVQSADMRNAPSNWLIGVQRKESAFEGVSIHIHNEPEWIDALHALFVLQRPYEPPSSDVKRSFEEHKRSARLDAYHAGEE